jgi:hypothetical protein
MSVNEPTRTLGHLALYYVPGYELAARTLMTDLGCKLIDNGPAPGSDGFCSALLDPETANSYDNLVYLAAMNQRLWEVEDEVRRTLAGSPAAKSLRDHLTEWPELGPHFGVRYTSLEALEDALVQLARDAAPGGLLDEHIEITRFRARAGLDEKIDARMTDSRVFSVDDRPAFGDYIVQCFVKTDLFGALTSARTIELDFAFDRYFEQPPVFG